MDVSCLARGEEPKRASQPLDGFIVGLSVSCPPRSEEPTWEEKFRIQVAGRVKNVHFSVKVRIPPSVGPLLRITHALSSLRL